MRGENSTADARPAVLLPTTDAVRALGERLIGADLIVFPVRHHSPACAWQLRRLLNETRVCAVLVEGPRSFTQLIPQLTHADARMPLAIYSYAVFKAQGDDAPVRKAAYYPFCDHSPELVALRHAQVQGIPARFIDLDFAQQSEADAIEDDGEARSLLDERHFRRSRYLGALASQLGCRDHEELWEHLFEVPAAGRSPREHVTDMAAYCHLARVDCSDEELQADGTLQREAEMARHVREALAQRGPGDGPVLAVVGGFHAVVMHALLDGHAADKAKPAKASSRSIDDAASALIRYGFDRLDRLNGYSAGMTSPAWHQQLWERMLKHDKAGIDTGARVRRDTALEFLFDIALELREKHGLPLPMPTLAGAYEQTLRLAALRQRPAPVREDVFDAVTSCFVKGDADADGALVLAVARRAFSGRAMGQVPPGVDRPPLVRDFEARARRQKLKIDDGHPRRAVLEIYRREDHRITSRLFHGLYLLGVPLANRVAGPDFVNGIGLDRLQEHWEYTHSAATEAALVEASVYGTTVPLAVANRFGQRLERFESGSDPRSAKAAAMLLIQACVLGLHDHLPRVSATLARAVGEDAAFESVAMAAGTLGLLWESREPLEARTVSELLPLLQAAYERAIYLGGDMKGVAGDGSGVIAGLARLRELLVSEAGRGLDAALYWSLVDAMQRGHANALVRGAASGLLYGAARLSEADLGIAVEGHLNGLTPARDAVAFLRGLLQTAREAAWQQPGLLSVLDRLLLQWDEAGFIAALPELRLAFAEMTPKETDRIAEAVAKLHGRDDLGSLVRRDITAEEVQANLVLSQQLIEQLKADGLSNWVIA
jgi:Family of unknown function (DUF5682)